MFSTKHTVKQDMCLSGPPGSTVAGRDGADGTNNNRGSVPCGANHNLDPNSGNINTVLGDSGTGDNAGSAADDLHAVNMLLKGH